MQYYVQNGADGSFIEQILDPAHLIPNMVQGEEVFAQMREMQRMTDSNARTVNGVKQAGYADKGGHMKVIARLPESVAIALLAVEPDLFKDAKTFNRILKKYPIYKAYTVGRKE